MFKTFKKIIVLYWIFLFSAFFCPAKAQEVKNRLTSTDSGHIDFMSANRRTTFRQMYRRTVIFDEAIYGELSFPKAMRPGEAVPAVVIMHSSSGVTDTIYNWAQYFNDMGIASFVVNSFTPRGIQRTAEDQSLLSFPASAADALSALQLMATDPAIDSKKIAVIGFSRGGGAALHSSFEKVRQSVIKDDTKFAIHLLFYPSCSEYAKTTGAPIRIFLGTNDAYNTLEGCQYNVAALQSTGADVDMTVYEGAEHGFDTSAPRYLWVKNATTARDCTPGTMNIDNGQAELIDGKKLSAQDFVDYRHSCTKRGLHVGSNPKYREMSRVAVKQLLQNQFGLAQ
jgi:dienelactone hydrolase